MNYDWLFTLGWTLGGLSIVGCLLLWAIYVHNRACEWCSHPDWKHDKGIFACRECDCPHYRGKNEMHA